MKKAVQVVFLIDLDDLQWNGNYLTDPCTCTDTLRRICLRLLAYFAAQQCVANGSDVIASTLVKWGYKFYLSRSKRVVHQRYSFQDLELDSLEQFENDLKNHLQKTSSEFEKSTGTCSANCLSTERSSGGGALEQAIKELLCDFPWDSPYISSPVKRPRIDSPTQAKRNGNDANVVDNYTILITGVPSTSDELNRFLGKEAACRPSVVHVLDGVVSRTVRQHLCNVAKIRLIWLDAFPFYLHGGDKVVEQKERQQTLEVLHQALSAVGGGILPVGAVLLRDTLRDGFGQIGASYHRFNFPESYRLRIPFASVMSVYLNYPDVPRSDLHHCEASFVIPSEGSLGSASCAVELLPLFRKECRDASVPKGASSPVCLVEARDGCQEDSVYTLQSLKPLGRVKLSDMRSQLMADHHVYLCFPRKATGCDTNAFQNLLDDLSVDYSAMVVLCDTTCMGILVPANDDSCVAVLYLLLETTVSSTSFSTGEDNNIVSVVRRLMVPLGVSDGTKTYGGLPPELETSHQFKKWLKNDASNCKTKRADRGEEELLQRLDRCCRTVSSYQSEDPKGWHSRHSPRSLKRQRNSISQRASKMISNSLLYSRQSRDEQCLQKQFDSDSTSEPFPCPSKHAREIQLEDAFKTIRNKGDLTSKESLLDDIRNTYDHALVVGGSLLNVAQIVVLTVQEYNRNCISDEERDEQSREFLAEHILLNSRALSTKYGKLSESQKSSFMQECCLQVLLRLEIQTLLCNVSCKDGCIDEVISLLRTFSFVAGPSALSTFVKDSIQENYYPYLKECVVEICEELNQPLPDETVGSSSSPTPSLCSMLSDGNEGTLASQLSHISTTSSVSSCSSQNKPQPAKRAEIVRHPSFTDVIRKRQIVVPLVLKHENSNIAGKKLLGSSGTKSRRTASCFEKGSQFKGVRRNLFDSGKSGKRRSRNHAIRGFAPTNKHYTPPKHAKPVTPKGRHVLKTKKVLDTPVHKQVAHVALARQLKKRQTSAADDDELDSISNIVEESPDKIWGDLQFRRSPRKHASSLERQASFYAADAVSRNLAKAESQLKAERENDAECYQNGECEPHPVARDDALQSPWPKRRSGGRGKDGDASRSAFPTHWSSRGRVRRHLNLGRTLVKKRNLESMLDAEGAVAISPPPRRSRRFKCGSSADDGRPVSACEARVLGCSSAGFDERNLDTVSAYIGALQDPDNEEEDGTEDVSVDAVLPAAENGPEQQEEEEDDVRTSETQDGTVAPLEDLEPTPSLRPEADADVPDGEESGTDHIVVSTPLRNGIESPTECRPTDGLPFPRGPLMDNLEDYFSRSSSPRIPLLVSEMGIAFDDDLSNYEPLNIDYDDDIWSDCSDAGSPFNDDVVAVPCDLVALCSAKHHTQEVLDVVASLVEGCATALADERWCDDGTGPSENSAVDETRAHVDDLRKLRDVNGISSSGKIVLGSDEVKNDTLFKWSALERSAVGDEGSPDSDGDQRKATSPTVHSVLNLATSPILASVLQPNN